MGSLQKNLHFSGSGGMRQALQESFSIIEHFQLTATCLRHELQAFPKVMSDNFFINCASLDK
jgi:hypothetical protein